MKAEAPLPEPKPWSWFPAVVANLIPRKFFAEYMDSSEQMSDRPLREQIVNAGDVLIKSYKTLMVRAVNGYEFAAELLLVTSIFATAGYYGGISPRLIVPSLASLLALAMRDAYSYQYKTGKITGHLTALQKYWLDSAIDAICAMLFSIVAQGFVLYLEPALAVPDPELFRASLVTLPLIAALRMMFRPMPAPESPGRSEISAVIVWRWAFGAALIWFFLFVVTIMLGTSDIHNYTPDKLRGYALLLPVWWVVFHRDGLARRDPRKTQLKQKEQQKLQRIVNITPEPLKPGEPFYRSWRSSEVLIFAGLALSAEAVVRPWLQGWEGRNASFLMVMANVIGFAICACTWKYVKALIYEAGQLARYQLHEIKRANLSV